MATGSAAEEALYKRIGGYDAVAAIVDEFSQTFAADPKMARFVSSMNLDRRKRNRQLTVDYLCAMSGGPAFYLGQEMKAAHGGLAISASEWQATMEHVERAIKKFNLGDRERKEFLALFQDLKNQIVER